VKANLAVGDEVRVFGGHRQQHPPTGTPAKVTKVGRTIATIRWAEGWNGEAMFYMATGDQKQTGEYTNYAYQFLTPADADRKALTDAARSDIREAGLTIEFRAKFTDDQILQLAELVRGWATAALEQASEAE
jgi:hypothetical protein